MTLPFTAISTIEESKEATIQTITAITTDSYSLHRSTNDQILWIKKILRAQTRLETAFRRFAQTLDESSTEVTTYHHHYREDLEKRANARDEFNRENEEKVAKAIRRL